MRVLDRIRRAICLGPKTLGTPLGLEKQAATPEQIGDPSASESSYSADQPIRLQSEDRFNRWPFAERMADTLARRPSSAGLVVAICGIWGDGKTSTLNLLEQALEKYQDEVIKKCLSNIGLSTEWIYHGIKREIFVVLLASNTREFLRGDHARLSRFKYSQETLFRFFRDRWLIPRSDRDHSYREWHPENWRLWSSAAARGSELSADGTCDSTGS